MGEVVEFPNQPSKLSIRAATWVAASCVRRFCTVRGIESSDIEAYCAYLEQLAVVESIHEWDNAGKALVVTGLGDPLPGSLQKFEKLDEILGFAREVSASQIYGAWVPRNVAESLSKVALLAGINPFKVVTSAMSLHDPGSTGWGVPARSTDLKNLKIEA